MITLVSSFGTLRCARVSLFQATMQLTIALLTSATLVTLAAAYPSGAPDFACDTMIPLHGVGPQSGDGGYSVSVNGGSSFTPGKANAVKLSGSDQFKGFLIRFSTSSTTSTATTNAGSWSSDVPSNAHIDCTDKSGVTHSDSSLKGSMELQWMAPESSGDVYFHFTVVTNFTTFYTDQVFKASSATVPENQIDL